MSIHDRHPHGTFSYAELATTDAGGARAFYTSLFGWEVDEMPMEPGGAYYMFRRGEHVAAAMHEIGEAQRARGIPPHWGSYVTVDGVDRSAARAGELGGTVLMEPFDVMEAGRMAVVQDPTGAVVSLWEARGHPGAQVRDEPGAFCWNELATPDTERAAEFYTGLFGWTTQTQDMGGGMLYTTFLNGGAQAGGMYRITPEMEGMTPHWAVYFSVEDCDAESARARSLGGRVHVEPTDIPDVGRFSILEDPQGATFAIIRMLPMQQEPPARGDDPVPA
ncbi:MAG TPA: VOC family protein [Longimicrobiaceae bacterium]|nr:VOC family protein [Longimicrobiaceae bacterium]